MDSENQLDLEIQTSMSSSPAPSDPAHILCRCGIESDGHREAITQEIVCCDGCGRYTHLACLTYCLAPRISGQFLCHICNPKITDFTNYIPPARKSLRRPHSMKTAHERLFPGKGALVKLHVQDKYFYPACILATDAANGTSTVHMWRGIHGNCANKTFIHVPNSRIIDALYGNTTERCSICLGKYDRPHVVTENMQNFWTNYKTLPCDTYT
ncbi:hypothetical protein GYMLUDRAFT_1017563 [Collybiopsis luxurians FD-317 M1]|uniref:Unplaced genomic scaffold GYMLUscaffold_56, whole genome shotgun sequence n=1 Tax=Collybiopsis luxurians FD-317 M1 TaxID=944289 RepID=A0A0D0CKM6_9AGAR|nr:hypothetical protein GYMLUDRAFT_1017563 [Collybiopsis luxurians FD-317 M1]